jgi:hypothetical protein
MYVKLLKARARDVIDAYEIVREFEFEFFKFDRAVWLLAVLFVFISVVLITSYLDCGVRNIWMLFQSANDTVSAGGYITLKFSSEFCKVPAHVAPGCTRHKLKSCR